MKELMSKSKAEISTIFQISLGVFIAVSLMGYNPKDPSLNSIGNTLKASNHCGVVGSFLSDLFFQLFGIVAWLIPVSIIFLTIQKNFLKEKKISTGGLYLMMFFMSMSTGALLSCYWPEVKFYEENISIGGTIGASALQGLAALFNPIGAQILLWSIVTIETVMILERKVKDILWAPVVFLSQGLGATMRLIKKFWAKKDKTLGRSTPPREPVIEKEHIQQQVVEVVKNNPPPPHRKINWTKKIENWMMPKIELLDNPPESRLKIDKNEIQRKADKLKEKLLNFSIEGDIVEAKPGPLVTLYEFKPNADVKISKISELEDDLSLALSSESVRVIGHIPGRDVVGIETSNVKRETVFYKELISENNFWKDDIVLPMALGRNVEGDSRIVDLRKMPHLLIAGTTGSGKSVFVASIITGLIFKHSPKSLRMVLIDPKMVDLAHFAQIPHLILPHITESKKAVSALRWAVREMEKRYRSLSQFGASKLEVYNQKVEELKQEEIQQHEEESENRYYFKPLPYIVIVIDELADLMVSEKQNIEQPIQRLTQMARACGMHLIIATQSPRKDVVTGLIKTNIPGRVALKVSSKMDSRIILDDSGAERLLPNGDMLFLAPGVNKPTRHHGPFLSDKEIQKVVQFWAEQGQPEYDTLGLKTLDGFTGESGTVADGDFFEEEYDEKYDEILSWAADQKEVSASLIQRRFRLGYPRAARIIEIFEKEGVVGPANGSKPRLVLVSSHASQIL